MKIVEIINSLSNKGGAEVFMLNLSRELISLNHDVFVITLYSKVLSDYNDSIAFIGDGNYFSCDKKSSLDFKSSKKLHDFLCDINPDVVHMHNGCTITYFEAFHNRKVRWKTFVTLHNIPNKETGLLDCFVRKKMLKKGNISLIGISDEISRLAEKKYSSKVYTIYNGIPIKNPSSYKEKKYDFICVARFSSQKNHQLLIKTFADFIFVHPEAKLCLVGDGGLLDSMKQLVCDLHCDNNVFFAGQVTNPYIYLNQSNVFILTSVYEGNPISILEAMDCGLPIIASRVGGVPDIVEDGINGFLFHPNDQATLLGLMEKMFSEKELIKIMGNNSLQKIKSYSMISCAKQYVNLFENNDND